MFKSLERSLSLPARFFAIHVLLSTIGCAPEPMPVSADVKANSGLQVETSVVNTTPVVNATTAETPDRGRFSGSAFRFREIEKESGFDFERYDDMKGQRRILEVNGGGAAIFDLDRDGWLDVFMTNGCRLPLSKDTRQSPGKLFRNHRTMNFRDCSLASGLEQFGFCFGCAVADANEDGFEDLYITAFGGNQFWTNNGDGTFSEVAATNGTWTGKWSAGAAFADLNGDQCLDLYVVNYLNESDEHPKLCPEPTSPDGFVGCTPAVFVGVPDILFLSDGAGGYMNASADAGLNELPGKGLGIVIADFGGDQVPEIYIANDGAPNFLFTIERTELIGGGIQGIRLHEEAIAANAALNEQGFAQASMGVAAADFDHNGAMDIFLTHFIDDTNTMYLNRTPDGGPLVFEDATRQTRLGPPSFGVLGFGVANIDIDNNGWQDLVIANGHVDDRTWMKAGQPYQMLPQIFENLQDSTFREVSEMAGTYFQKPVLGRGLATGDFDRDGFVDVVISHQRAASTILKNETAGSRAVTLRFVGRTASRTTIGLKVRVLNGPVPRTEQMIGGGSFQAASSNELYLGGIADGPVDLEVTWPTGHVETLQLPTAGYWIIAEKGQLAAFVE